MIDHATVEKIKNTADIVDVVGDYVHLIRRGSNYMGLCPFHNERTPSFSVNKSRNFCYCFSCKKGGSPVNFIMEKEGLSYHEALLHLAKRYGIDVQERELTDEERQRQSAREAMFVANEWAMKQMEHDLRETEEGRDVGLQYFTQREVTDEAMKAFHLGYAIDKGDHLVNEAKKAGFSLDVLKQLGLVGTSQSGRDYDRFRGRVIFPILNTAGKVIAFGGRDLKGGLAKYINSPESDLYKKSNELYGIFQAKPSIVKENKCYLVEGYMDVIGMWQSGMKNVVASSGTALTDGQIAMIHRFTENITLIYDGDAAGIKASLRGIDMLLSHKMNVKVMLLPDGDDPDSFARKHTPEEFREYVASHETDIIRYKAQVMLNDIKNDPQNRIKAINSVVESIANIPDAVSRDVYIQECSDILGIPETTIAKSVAQARFALVEKIKQSRLRKEYPVSETPQNNAPAAEAGVTIQPATANPQESYPFYPLEFSVIKYCVRYGYLQFCSWTEEDGSEQSLNVMEFVREELLDDDIHFSVPVFKKIFGLLEEMHEDFKQYLEEKKEEIRIEAEKKRKEGLSEIAEKDLSVLEIEKEEKKLDERIAGIREEFLFEVTKDYPSRRLASHEDKDVRDATLKLIFEKHSLSNIFLKDHATELESEKLETLVPRAITEWKNEIINMRIRELVAEFHKISGKGDNEKEEALQKELRNLMNIRIEIAKNIGDRIVYTRRR